MAKHEYYAVQGKTLGNIAETMKAVLGVDKDTPIRFDEITNNEKAEQVIESVDAQAEVIEQIKTALNGKSSLGVKEIIDIIDESEVLGTFEGTATEKVEQLIDMAEDEKRWFRTVANVVNASRYFENYPFARLPKLPVLHSNTLAYWFANTQLERVDFYINIEPETTFVMNSVFQNNNKLTFIYGIGTHKCTDIRSAFKDCSLLETIQEPLDFSNVTNNQDAFSRCGALKNVFFVPETIKISITIPSPVLSDESIQSIIDGLATVETTQTLTLHADVKAKLTEEQLATITNKNWNLA